MGEDTTEHKVAAVVQTVTAAGAGASQAASRPVETKAFNPDGWKGTGESLSLETINTLRAKGYLENAPISVALTMDSIKVMTTYNKQDGLWVDGNRNWPMELSQAEISELEARMPNLPPQISDYVVARYFWLRGAVEQYSGIAHGRTSAEFSRVNQDLVKLMVAACFSRETQGAGAKFHTRSSDNVWINSTEDRLAAVLHGQRVAREFAELIPPAIELH